MEEADKDWMMIRMVGGYVFLLVLAHPGSPGQRATKRLLLLCCCPFNISILTFHRKNDRLYRTQLSDNMSTTGNGCLAGNNTSAMQECLAVSLQLTR